MAESGTNVSLRSIAVLVVGLILCLSISGVYAQEVNNCLTCHQSFEGPDGPSHLIQRDVHIQNGLGCVDCHGGDASLEDMDEVRRVPNYRGVPNHFQVPEFCARCHSDATYMRNHNPALPTDQLAKYKTSVHGQRLFSKHDPKVANCISCHTVHEIGSGKMPLSSSYPTNIPFTCGKCHADSSYMAEYDIPTDQLANFQKSVHGKALLEDKDLGAPSCNDCHSNHGAAPPGLTSLAAVCGNCHAIEADLFRASPHKEAFDANDLPECETCHSNHLVVHPQDSWVGTTDDALCVNCHSADDGTPAFVIADSMSVMIGELVAAHELARELLDEAQQKGMMATDEEFMIKDVHQALIKARTQVHSLDLDEIVPIADTGLAKADTVQVKSAELIDDYYFRRRGLALATIFITIVAVALYLKIRRLG